MDIKNYSLSAEKNLYLGKFGLYEGKIKQNKNKTKRKFGLFPSCFKDSNENKICSRGEEKSNVGQRSLIKPLGRAESWWMNGI